MRLPRLPAWTSCSLVLLAVAAGGGARGAALRDADLAMGWTVPENRKAPAFSEQMVLKAFFDGGARADVKLVVTNVAGANGRAELKASVRAADGRSWSARTRKGAGSWTTESSRFAAVVGDSKVSAGVDGAEVEVRGDGFRLTLVLENLHRPLRPPGGSADFGQGRFYRTTLLAPRAKVTGTLVLDAGHGGAPETIPLDGRGWAEHRVGNVAPYAMSIRTFNVLEVDAARTFALSAFERLAGLGGGIQGFVYHATDERVDVYAGDASFRPAEFENDAVSGYRVPKVLHVQAPELAGVVKGAALEHRIDDLESLSKVERLVVERLMRPWTLRYDAEYLLKVDGTTLRGKGRYGFQQIKAER